MLNPISKKSVNDFVAKYSGNSLPVHWVEPGQLVHFPTADGKIFLEQRRESFEGINAEEQFAEFVASLCGTDVVGIAFTKVENRSPINPNTGAYRPPCLIVDFGLFEA